MGTRDTLRLENGWGKCCHVIDLGIRKFNVGTELLVRWNRKSKELYDTNKENTSNRNNVIPALDVVTEVVEHKIHLFKNIK